MTIEKKNSNKKKTDKKNYAELFMDRFQERHKPVSQEYINLIAAEMLNWSDLDTSFIFNEFIGNLPHTRTQIYNWAKEHPVLAHAMETCKTKLAVRREKRAAEDPKYGIVYQKGLAVYDYEYRDSVESMEAMRSKYRKEENENKQTVVVIDRVPDSPMVPKRKVKETK